MLVGSVSFALLKTEAAVLVQVRLITYSTNDGHNFDESAHEFVVQRPLVRRISLSVREVVVIVPNFHAAPERPFTEC